MPFDDPTKTFTAPRYAREVAALDEVLRLLEPPGGWIQGKLMNGRGGYCLVGAFIAQATTGLVMTRLIDTLGATGYLDLGTWNDAHGRKKEEVLDLVRRARASFMTG